MLAWLIGCALAGDVAEIDVAALHTLREEKTAHTLLDVRKEEEVATVRVPGITHIPLDQLPERTDELDKALPVYVICHSGFRSAKATKLLTEQGFTATNVAGGTAGWEKAGYPVERGTAVPKEE